MRKGKCAVIKTSTRQTVFLPLIGLVPAEKLKQLEEEHKRIDKSNKLLAADIRSLSTSARHGNHALDMVPTQHIQSLRSSKRRPGTQDC